MNLSLANILKANRFPGTRSPVARRLASGGFWSLAAEVGSRPLAFAGAIIVARWLGVAEFGVFALIQSTLLMMATFAVFGMEHTSSRYIAAYRSTDPARIQGVANVALLFSGLTGLVGSAALFVAAPYVATNLFRTPELVGPLRMVAPVLFLYAIAGAMVGLINGFEAFQRLARLAWVSSLGSFIAVVAGVSLWGLPGALVGILCGEVLRCALTIILAREVMQENGLALFGRAHASEVKILWQFSLPMFLASALHSPIMWLCHTIIARQPNGMAELGLYNAAQKWMTVVTMVPIAASGAFGPVLASLSGGGHVSSHRTTTLRLALIQAAFTVGPALLVAFAAPGAMSLFGEQFVPGSAVIIYMMLLAPIMVSVRLLWQALLSMEHAWTSFLLWLLWAIIALTLTWAWQTQGALGLSQAMLIAYGLTLLGYLIAALLAWHE